MVSSDVTHSFIVQCVPESTRDVSNQSHGQVETVCLAYLLSCYFCEILMNSTAGEIWKALGQTCLHVSLPSGKQASALMRCGQLTSTLVHYHILCREDSSHPLPFYHVLLNTLYFYTVKSQDFYFFI